VKPVPALTISVRDFVVDGVCEITDMIYPPVYQWVDVFTPANEAETVVKYR
jgi:hypothetical protein